MNQRKKKVMKRRKFTGLKLVIMIFISIGILGVFVLEKDNKQEISSSHIVDANQLAPTILTDDSLIDGSTTEESAALYKVSSDLRINSANAVLMDLENGNVLYGKNAGEIIYPASMTKIMTAVIVLENVTDLNEKVLLNNDIFQTIYNENASVAGFLPDENVRVIDLLYGLLLPSGAECAVGLAEYVAGSENEFVNLMNRKAEELGMSGTSFINTTGLHNKNHYSTAKDMAVLFQYALKDNTFYEIISSSKHSTPSTNRHDGGITYYSTLFSKIDNTDFDGGYIVGGKTGYTEEAGQCLASLAEKDGTQYILVTSGAYNIAKTQSLHIDDAVTVYTAIASVD